MNSIFLDIHNLRVLVSSNCDEFLWLIKNNLSYFFVKDGNGYDIRVKFTYNRGIHFQKDKNLMQSSTLIGSTGSKVYVNERYLSISDFGVPNLNISIEVTDSKYLIDAVLKRRKKDIILMRGLDVEKLIKISRFIIHYPVFQFMQEKMGLLFLHASAIEKMGKGYIFIGLPGAGKTRCVMHLIGKDNINFLSDNFILCNDKKEIFAFPEFLRINESQGKFLESKDSINRLHIRGVGKTFFKVNDRKVKKTVQLKKIFFLKRSDRKRLVKSNLSKFLSDLIAIEKFTKDFYEYSYIDLLNLAGVKLKSLSKDRRTKLGNLLKGIDCYELYVKENSLDLNLIEEIM